MPNAGARAYTGTVNHGDRQAKSWLRRGVEGAIRNAFLKAYDTIKVDPENYLQHLRMAYNLPALTYDGRVFG